MSPEQERIFEAKAEREFAGHRGLINGRNFLWNVMRFHGGAAKKAYDIGQCRTFPLAPGNRLCGACQWEDCELRKEN